jgi:hypothetical protein
MGNLIGSKLLPPFFEVPLVHSVILRLLWAKASAYVRLAYSGMAIVGSIRVVEGARRSLKHLICVIDHRACEPPLRRIQMSSILDGRM